MARRQQRLDELQYQLEAAWRLNGRRAGDALQRIETRLLRQDVSHRMRVVRERLLHARSKACPRAAGGSGPPENRAEPTRSRSC